MTAGAHLSSRNLNRGLLAGILKTAFTKMPCLDLYAQMAVL